MPRIGNSTAFGQTMNRTTTAEEAQIGISVIRHELRMIRFMTAKQIENKLEIIGRLERPYQ